MLLPWSCRYFLHVASSFNQDLCKWGETIGNPPYRTYVFTSTACPNKGNPNLSASPKGPFCYVCPPPPSSSPSEAPTSSPSEAPTPVPTVSPTSDYFETAAELRSAVTSGVYTAGDSPYGAIEVWDTSRWVGTKICPQFYIVLSTHCLPSLFPSYLLVRTQGD